MSEILQSLKPQRLWEIFEEICKYPRLSKHEEKIAAYIIDFAKQNNLEWEQDKIGNIVIRKPAHKGYEDRKTVVLQSHIDMVGEKDSSVDHDFENDPIQPYINGDWVRAKGTTLGADDGIGIAAQLAILESKDIAHGPIECLFTIDEETGMTGAFGLESGFIKGDILLNLDSEDEGELFIGCAGGKDTKAEYSYKIESVPSNYSACLLKVSGLKGGHSGDEIDKELGNAIKILARILWNISKEHDMKLHKIEGGKLRNAIPREAEANFLCSKEEAGNIIQKMNKLGDIIKEEYKKTDENLLIQIEKVELPKYIIDDETKNSIINALYICPHGVTHMTPDIPNLVETSTNLATIVYEDDRIVIGTSQRSSVESRRDNIADTIEAVFSTTGGKVSHSDGYPGWTPNLDSEILSITKHSYEELFREKPKVLAIHAGLECGLIGKKYPGLDMISFGPTIKGAHTPEEGIEINTTKKFWDLLLDVLEKAPMMP